MAIFTAEELTEQIAAYKAALLALATHQEYAIGSRRVRRADLPQIRETLRFLEEQQTALTETAGRRRVGTIPRSSTW